MSRLTTTVAEIRHLSDITRAMPLSGIIEVALHNGARIEGALRGSKVGNNFKSGMAAPTAYYADVTIQTLQGDWKTIDVLDIASVRDVWADRCDAYEAAGLIQVVR
ncbi:hypothetical protein ACTJK4_24955 [Ralstonia sp. 22111]|uniref:hypothetical protein n=1 Tax=Ralstonia sp. 22111 TaxID=3453878 RepID=UPI003F8780D9